MWMKLGSRSRQTGPERRVWAVLTVAISLWMTPELGQAEPASEPAPIPAAASEAPVPAAPPAPGTTFRDCAHCPDMTVIPAGRFKMGSPRGQGFIDEWPEHEVSIPRDLAVGTYEITVGQFRAFAEATGYEPDAACRTIGEDGWPNRPDRHWHKPGFDQTDDHPVLCVQWGDARGYIAWLNAQTGGGYRLLSEAEWEYAARAGTDTDYHFGTSADAICDYANVADQSVLKKFRTWLVAPCRDEFIFTAPVGSFKPNPFGLYDMNGNLWEWVEDCYVDNYDGAPTDGSARHAENCRIDAKEGARVLRGGAWSEGTRNLRSAARSRMNRNVRYYFYGFRVAKDLMP